LSLMNWTESYSVGVDSIDEQHQELFDVVNRLHLSMKEGTSKETFSELLREVANYAIYHFENEEKYMRQFDYPDLDKHKDQHDTFVSKVLDLQSQMDQGRLFLSIEMISFLSDWIHDHVLGIDQELGPFLDSQGVK
jgi:hemerythrin